MFVPWLVEFILRIIPEAVLFALASFVLTKTKIDKKKFILLSFILILPQYIIKLIPVELGINSLLSLALLAFLNVKINKVKTIESIKASVLIFITMFVAELINIVFLQVVLKINMNEVFKDLVTKSVSGIPSLFIFSLVIFIVYKISKKSINR